MNVMNATFISYECKHDQSKNHNQDDALFVFRKLENSQEALHSVWRSFGIPFVVLERLHVLIHVAVMLSEAKHLWLVRAVPDQTIRD